MTLIERARQLRPLIIKAAQSLEDKEALTCLEFYDNWSADNVDYSKNYKVKYNGKLYKVLIDHVSQSSWTPEAATSLFAVINETHAGTLEDPIPYDGNMELFTDTYYMQDNVVYKCTRDSGIAMHHALKDLIGLYVEVVNE